MDGEGDFLLTKTRVKWEDLVRGDTNHVTESPCNITILELGQFA